MAASTVTDAGCQGRADTADDAPPRLPEEALSVQSILFTPGAGSTPRHIAGRGRERQVLWRIVRTLMHGAAPPHDAVLHGPRGIGKTVILSWLAKSARGAGVRVIDTVANYISTLDDVYAETLTPPVAQRFSGMRQPEWRDLLTDACKGQPTIMLVDEAHTLDLDVARALLNTAQFTRRNDAPFALVLAGTPHLKQHLLSAEPGDLKPAGARSSFWERLGEGDLRLGLLSPDEAEEALREPLKLRPDGLPYDEAAVQAMAAASDRYPYFLQLWGQQAELQARMGEGRLDMKAVAAARPDVERICRMFYGGRISELDQLGLYPAVRQVAPLFAEPGAEAGRDDVLAAISHALAEGDQDAPSALNAMLLLGVLEDEPETRTMRACIPSFFGHIAQIGSGHQRG